MRGLPTRVPFRIRRRYGSPCLRLTTTVLPVVALALPTALLAQTPESHGPVELVEMEMVEIVTPGGVIRAELYPDRAPVTAENFLAYVSDGTFDGGSFFRVVRLDNQPNDPVRIEVVQGGPPRSLPRDRYRPPIDLERTRDTGLRHVDGALSMARGGPDTARAQFFICIGDQPSLDYGGARNPDGQGFAVFGRVVEGMDVVRRIQAGEVEGQRLLDPVTIERIVTVPGPEVGASTGAMDRYATSPLAPISR